ncbi:DUF6311 domain-containing protein [Dyella sp. ASV21]|uniref:DUF6311 domain-containing protein n=1 Tax=Dyella sp. ASV21 TaxID=2795114 RepID=UPI0018EA81E2|nr:DUF6311 domain-containing protein [Dyella sp. ASV21]
MFSTHPRRDRTALFGLLPVLLGVAAFVLVTGGNLFVPGNVLWLQHQDLAQSYLGWAFYRHDPWSWPWGANPSYGLEIHSSVYYSDSIPLLAMLLKPLSPLLPEPFQYFGLWVLLCFVLQAVFAWRLLALASDSLPVRLLGSVFFVLAPPMLLRLGGHMALFGQWSILAGLWLYLRPSSRPRFAWTALVAVTMLIHAYLFLMVTLLWMADLLRRALEDRAAAKGSLLRSCLRQLPEVMQVLLVTGVVAWAAGFFMVPGGGQAASGFGYYKMNLLAPFNGAGWSWFGLSAPQAAGEYEGFNYLGLGGLVVCLLALLVQVIERRRASSSRRRVWPLAAVALVLTVVAITQHVGVGAWQVTLSLPAWLERKVSHASIQSTGRLFWVAYYALLLWAFFTLARVLSARALAIVLAVALVLQLADLYPGLMQLHQTLVQRTQVADTARLHGPFWDAAGQRYTRLRRVPTRVLAPGWEVLARYALEHRMGTDAVQVARVNWKLFNRLRDEQLKRIADATPETQTLYILDDALAATVARSARPQDAVFRLDGWNVLAPAWGGALPAGAVDLKSAP